MKTSESESCVCISDNGVKEKISRPKKSMLVNLGIGGVGLYLWWVIYGKLLPLSRFITYSVLRVKEGTHLGESLEFFFYDTLSFTKNINLFF